MGRVHSGGAPSPVGDEAGCYGGKGRAAGEGQEVLGLNIIKAGAVA